MDLFFIRHGEAEPEAAHDAGRALTPAGRAGISGVARGLARRHVRPEAIWHSPYLRAQQTALMIQAAIGGQLLEDGRFVPDAPARAAAQAILSFAEQHPAPLVVVGHLPLLPSLVDWLAAERVSFGTGSVAYLRVEDTTTLVDVWSAATLGANP